MSLHSRETLSGAGDTPYTAKVRRDAAQSLTTDVWHEIQWDAVTWDTGDMVDSGALPDGDVDIPVAGKYHCTLEAGLAPSVNKTLMIWFLVNAVVHARDKEFAPVIGEQIFSRLSGTLDLSAGDVVTAEIRHGEGSSLNTETDVEGRPRLSIHKIAD